MSTRSDEVYEGIRCAVCEELFTNRDVVAVLWDTGERRHYECPTTPEVVMDTPSKRSPWKAVHNSGVLMHLTKDTPDHQRCTNQFISAFERAWPWTRAYVAYRLWRWRRRGCP